MMRLCTNRRFVALLPSAALIAAVFALSACELAYHELSAERDEQCTPWKVGCRPVINVAGEGPIQPTRYDVQRMQIVGAAERAPYRQCDTLAFGCQLIISVDAFDDQYIRPLRSDPQ